MLCSYYGPSSTRLAATYALSRGERPQIGVFLCLCHGLWVELFVNLLLNLSFSVWFSGALIGSLH